MTGVSGHDDTALDTIDLDQISHDYLALAFGLDQHIDGFIDAWTGPDAIRDRLVRAEPATPDGLLEQAQALDIAVDAATALPPERRAYLRAQVRAMVALARRLTGEPLDYRDEVRLCFDVPADRTPDEAFDEALRTLDDVLPGRGDLAARMAEWKTRYVISPDDARRLLDVIVPEIRSRTRRIVQLPAGESVEFTLVDDKPWSGYNWFLGNATSRVEINTDLPIHINTLTGLVCHEAYPGHHTEHSLRERRLFRGRGWGEFGVQLISTPQAVISEGIATLAESIVFPDDEGVHWQVRELYPAAGIEGNAEQEIAVQRAQRVMRALGANAALMLHADGASEADVIAWLRRYGLRTEQEARHQLRFIQDPLWRAYIFTYHSGRDLLGRWLHQADPDEVSSRFVRLLTEPVTPSSIAVDTHA